MDRMLWNGSPPFVPSIPDDSSIYGIARRYNRERILVKPLHWTNRQLELLRFSFDEPSPVPKIDRTDSYIGRGFDDVEKRYMKYHLRRFHLFESRKLYFGDLLFGLNSPFSSYWTSLPVDLKRSIANGPTADEPTANGPYSSAPCEGIYLRKPRAQWLDPEYPIGAYIDRGHIEEMRKESLNLHTCDPRNAPVYSISSRKLEQLRPRNPFKDPYIAAVLIAVAQQRRVILDIEKAEELSTLEIYPSQVLYSYESKTYVYLYKADIPSLFLDMFDYPNIAPPELLQISIQAFKIPRTPVSTFRDRILALMLHTASDRPMKTEN